MKAVEPAYHNYFLDNFEDPNKVQNLHFIHKRPGTDPGSLVTVSDGTTNEEVLKVLIHRLNGLNDKMPCRENALAIQKLCETLFWLEHRTQNRKSRQVEGKHLA